MLYPREALERAMKIQEVILRELSGEITWVQAAEILGCNPRSLRRWLRRYERWGYDGLLDRRRGRPSPRRVPLAEVQRILRLYRERYAEFSARHFWHFATRQHGVRLSYGWVKAALQTAGLVAKGRCRGRHRRRREPRPCVGELLHLDGSRHQWLALDPGRYVTLIAVVDDATTRLLYAELTAAGREQRRPHARPGGHPRALRPAPSPLHRPRRLGGAHPHLRQRPGPHAPHPARPRSAQLGIEHILGYSPQARGRSERLHRTGQDRLVKELKVAGIATLPAANRYLRERFLPLYDELFSRPPTTLPRPSSLSAASTSPRSCVTKRSASSPATTPSASTASCCSSPSSRGGPPARASASWSASI
jgi:transposase